MKLKSAYFFIKQIQITAVLTHKIKRRGPLVLFRSTFYVVINAPSPKQSAVNIASFKLNHSCMTNLFC